MELRYFRMLLYNARNNRCCLQTVSENKLRLKNTEFPHIMIKYKGFYIYEGNVKI